MADAYAIDYTPDAIRHLEGLSAGIRSLMLQAIDAQLRYEPTLETRKRKKLRPNKFATYRLRVSNYRVYYDVFSDSHLVLIMAIGLKKGTQLFIDGKETEL